MAEDEVVCDSSRSLSEAEEPGRSAAALSSFVGRLLGRSGVGGGDAWLVVSIRTQKPLRSAACYAIVQG